MTTFERLALLLLLFYPSVVYLCHYQLNEINGTVELPPYENNIQCTWIFNLSSIANRIAIRSLLINFRYFDTEFGHDELFIGETIADVSKYNSKLYRLSGSKLPDPCLIVLRGDLLTRAIWMEFTSDQTNTGSGFLLDYSFRESQSMIPTWKSKQILIDAEVRHPLEQKTKTSKSMYPYPRGSISSPNYPRNYSDNTICRWHIYHRHAFIRLYIDQFETESHYDTLTIQLGLNLNNRAMIVHEWSGSTIEQRDFFLRNDNFYLIFTTDRTNNASGFLLQYEVIEKEIFTLDVYEDWGIVHSKTYPELLRTNCEYTWNIHMNNSNEIQINLLDIQLDLEQDSLQVFTGEMIYSLTNPNSIRFFSSNQTKIVLRTKHSQHDEQYRGFNLTYQKWHRNVEKKSEWNTSPCGRTYSSHNGTIEFKSEILIALKCLILIEVDDGQNILLRFDYLNWDSRENAMEIGLFHDDNQNQIFRITDTIPGTSFISNQSQIWLRFSSTSYSLGLSTFRLSYSETIQWSTISPEPYRQILNDNRLFPHRLISVPTNDIYHYLTETYIWHIEALEDESIRITFQSFQVLDQRRLCFSIKSFFRTDQICSDEQFPYVYHHIGSCTLSIEPDFIWIYLEYNIQIEKFKKVVTINEMNLTGDYLFLSLPVISNPFVHIEWVVTIENYSSMLIFDIENFDGNIPAELIIPQNATATKIYALDKISLTRFSHVLFSFQSPVRIIYQSHGSGRLFRIHLHKISKNYFRIRDFHYIFFDTNQTNFQWTIHGQYDNSTFLSNLYSSAKNFSLQTTANTNLVVSTSPTIIPSSDFDIRYLTKRKSAFLLILYEQQQSHAHLIRDLLLTKTSDFIETNHIASYSIEIQSTIYDSIDFIILKADNNTIIRLYDFNSQTNGYFLLNFAVINKKRLTSLIGLRFSIQSLAIKIELQSPTKTPIQLRYKTRVSSSPHSCFIIDTNQYKNSCANWFDYKSMSMNNTRIDHIWPYALRGSVTLVIENTTIENFERQIYRNLRQSIAKIIRKYCSISQENCLSRDADAIRADHVIIQSYDEQIDNHRLYVAIFIKDPYRRTIALTNEQFFLALKRNRQEIYRDIQHHINLPTNISDGNALDPIWLYGVCLLALLVLLVVILMLIMILMRKTSRPMVPINVNRSRKEKHVISSPVQPIREEVEEQNTSSYFHPSENSDNSNCTLLVASPAISSFPPHSTARPSYFNSTIESAMKQRLEHDSEPIPFIDESVSNTRSRKSSACWSDRTSLSSRFSLIWKLNRMRSNHPNRSLSSNSKDQRRSSRHRNLRYTIPLSQPNDQL